MTSLAAYSSSALTTFAPASTNAWSGSRRRRLRRPRRGSRARPPSACRALRAPGRRGVLRPQFPGDADLHGHHRPSDAVGWTARCTGGVRPIRTVQCAEGHACGMPRRPRTPNAAAGMLLAVGSAQGADALTFVRMVRGRRGSGRGGPGRRRARGRRRPRGDGRRESRARRARRGDLRGHGRAAPARGLPHRHGRSGGRTPGRLLEPRGDRRPGPRPRSPASPAGSPPRPAAPRHRRPAAPRRGRAAARRGRRRPPPWPRTSHRRPVHGGPARSPRSPGTMRATPTDARPASTVARDVRRRDQAVDALGERDRGCLVTHPDEQQHRTRRRRGVRRRP